MFSLLKASAAMRLIAAESAGIGASQNGRVGQANQGAMAVVRKMDD
jgi:hypothetical protein